MERKEHKLYLDIVRIIASFGVIYNHVIGYRFFNAPGIGGIAAQFAFFLCKPAVPLFFMTSGLLLLPREDSYKKTYLRILRIGVVLVAMCAFYYAADLIRTGEAFSLRTLLLSIYRYEPANTNAFWFLYCYLGILVMLPILQRMLGGFDKRAFQYYFLVFWLLTQQAVVTQLWGKPIFSASFEPLVFSAYLTMMFAGLYIDRYTTCGAKGAWIAACAIVPLTAVSILLTRADAYAYDPNGNLFYDNCARPAVIAASACIYYLCKCAGQTVTLSERVRERLAGMGRLTFCIYLFGDFYINLLEPIRPALTGNDTSYLGTLLYTCAAYGLSTLTAALLTRIPGLKKWL